MAPKKQFTLDNITNLSLREISYGLTESQKNFGKICKDVGEEIGKEGKEIGKEGKEIGKEGKEIGKEGGEEIGKEGGEQEDEEIGKEGGEEINNDKSMVEYNSQSDLNSTPKKVQKSVLEFDINNLDDLKEKLEEHQDNYQFLKLMYNSIIKKYKLNLNIEYDESCQVLKNIIKKLF
ncbi:hypothetical protein ACTFIZ_002356 [Dictyostelium cf. discoideum]